MSEFGKGYAYCLGLFLCHDERRREIKDSFEKVGLRDGPEMWFYGAADHLYEFVIPDFLPPDQKKTAEEFKDRVMGWRLQWKPAQISPTWEDAQWAIQTAKDLLRGLDEHLGIESEKGDWE